MDNSASDIKQEELHITDYGHSYHVEDRSRPNLTDHPGSIEIDETDGFQPPNHIEASQNTGKFKQIGLIDDTNPEFKVKHEWSDDEYFCRIDNPVEDPLALPLEEPPSLFFKVEHETTPTATLLPVKIEQEDELDLTDIREIRESDSETDKRRKRPLARKPSKGFSVQSKSRSKKITKRKSYTAEFKCQVMLYAEKHSNCAAGRKYGINETCVRAWRRQRNALATCPSNTKALRGPKQGRHPKLEEEVLSYVLKLRNDGCHVSCDMIKKKSLEVARQQGIPLNTFSAGQGWIRNFKRRQGLSLSARSNFQQKFHADFPDKVLTFRKEVNNLRRAKDYLICQIGSADHTPVLLDFPSNFSIVCRNGVNEVTLNSCRPNGGKQRFTLMLSCTADGCKLPPFIIFKRKTVLQKSDFPKRVVVRANSKGAMSNELMVDWLKYVWLRRPSSLLSDDSMIVLDQFRGHLTDAVKMILKQNGTDVVTVPREMTSKLLPLDINLNKRFRVGLQKRYMEWLCRTNVKKLKRLKRIPLPLLADWVLAMWDAIPGEKLAELFKTCCIINSLEGTEQDLTNVMDDKAVTSKDDGDITFSSLSGDEDIDNNEDRSSEDSDSEGSYFDRSSSDADDDDDS